MESAISILDNSSKLVQKQKDLESLFKVQSLKTEQFETVCTVVESDLESEEESALLEVWRLEIMRATEAAAEAKEVYIHMLHLKPEEVVVVQALVRTVAQAMVLEHDLKQVKIEDTEEAARLKAELANSENETKSCTKNLAKLRRAKSLESRKTILLSPKRHVVISEATADFSEASKRQCVQSGQSNLSEEQMSLSSHETVERVQKAEEDGTVSVKDVIHGMLEDSIVEVILLHIPHEVSSVPTKYKSGARLDLFEALIAAASVEYTLCAKGEVAFKAMETLPSFLGKVVRLSGVKFALYKGTAQLELMHGFQAEQHHDSESIHHAPSKIMLNRLPTQMNRSRVSLYPCRVNAISTAKDDKNGNPYRSTRLVDVSGCVCNVMVWGALAEKDEVWKKDTVVDVRVVEVNVTDKRIDVRGFSNVDLAASTSSFKQPARLTFALWPGDPSA